MEQQATPRNSSVIIFKANNEQVHQIDRTVTCVEDVLQAITLRATTKKFTWLRNIQKQNEQKK